MKKTVQTQLPYELYREFRIACAWEGVSMTQKVQQIILEGVNSAGKLEREARSHLEAEQDTLSAPQPRQNVTFAISQFAADRLEYAIACEDYPRTLILGGLISFFLHQKNKPIR